jgi:hypothetical protein
MAKKNKKTSRSKHRGNHAKASDGAASHSPESHSPTAGPASQIGGAKKIENSRPPDKEWTGAYGTWVGHSVLLGYLNIMSII